MLFNFFKAQQLHQYINKQKQNYSMTIKRIFYVDKNQICITFKMGRCNINEMNIMEQQAEVQQLILSPKVQNCGLNFFCSDDIAIQCEMCHKRFNKKSHLYRHQREKHKQGQVKEFQCSYSGCSKKFKRGSHLKRHMISHTHQKNYQCSQCIMSFGYKHHLDRHIKLVHNKELFKCQQCPQQFMKKKSLSKHVKSHEDKKIGKKIKKTTHQNKNNKVKKQQQQNQHSIEVKSNKQSKQIRKNQIFQEEIYFSEEPPTQKILYKCSEGECFAAFQNQWALKRHITAVHIAL